MGAINFIFFLLLSNFFILNFGQLCQNFSAWYPFLSPTSVCSTILPQNFEVYVNNETCLQVIEQDVASAFPSTWFSLSIPCRTALSKYQCLTTYPACQTQTQINDTKYGVSIPPCQSICDEVSQKCSNATDQGVLTANGITLDGCSNSSTCQTIPDPTTVPVPQCETYRGTVCAGVIDYPIYVPATLSQEFLEAELAPISAVFAIAPRDDDCQKHTAAYYCSQTFMRCDTSVAGTIPFPSYPCKSVCLDYNASCSGLFQLDPILIPNCDAYGLAPDALRSCNGSLVNRGQDNFPETETVFVNISGYVLSSPCNSVSISSLSAQSSIFGNCPFPLVQPEDYDHVDNWILGSCALPCPSFTSVKDQNRAQDIEWTFLSWLAFIYFPIIALPYFLFPVKQKNFIIINLFISGLWGTIGPISGVFKGTAKGDPYYLDLSVQSTTLRCINNAMAYNSKESSLCGWMYFTSGVGGTSVACWWFIVAIDLFHQLVLEKKLDWASSKLKIGSLIYGWGVPLLVYGIALTKSTVSSTGTWVCGLDDQDVLWKCTMTADIINIAFGLPLVIMIVKKTYEVYKNGGTFEQLLEKVSEETLRLIVLLLFFLGGFCFIFIANGIGFYHNVTPVKDAAVAWLTCLLGNSADPFTKCGTAPTQVISPLLEYLFIFMTPITGLIIAVIFTESKIFHYWCYFVSAPNRFSLCKMTEENLCAQLPMKCPQSEPKAMELTQVETSLLPGTKPEPTSPDTPEDNKSPTSDGQRVLFNPFTIDPSPMARTSSMTASSTNGRPESPTSVGIDDSISGMESSAANPLFSLPSVAEQPLETSARDQMGESQSAVPLVAPLSQNDSSPMEQSP